MRTEPHPNCSLCPRLKRFRKRWRVKEPDWHNSPVETWGPKAGNDAVEILIVGLAPGLRGANRTGRVFTGDASGLVLHNMLMKHGFAYGKFENRADDSMELANCAITNVVRCVPPENKPIGQEINACRRFLSTTIGHFSNLKVVLTLGKIAHDSTLRALDAKVSAHPFGHNYLHHIGDLKLVSSYHCSRYNMNTGRLTEDVFESVFLELRRQLGN